MATSGEFEGNRTVTNGPQLKLLWSRIETDIAGNRSKLRLTLQVYSQYRIDFTARKYGSLQGNSFYTDVNMNGTNITRTIATRDIWVTHNNDGTKSQALSAWFDINVSWSTGYVGRIHVSGTANINTIPRKSTIETLNNFTIGAHPTFAINIAHSGFNHDIVARIGNTTIQEWRAITYDPTSLNFNDTADSRMYQATRSKTSETMRVYLNTRNSAGTLIGQDYKDIKISVGSGVQPVINSVSVAEAIASIRNNLGVYVLNKSRLDLEMTASAGTGASVSQYEIKANGATYTSRTAFTALLRSTGNMVISFKVTDSRGRTASTTRTINVLPYSPPIPKITDAFRSDANGNPDEDGEYGTVKYESAASSLGGNNTLAYQIRYKHSSQAFFITEDLDDTGTSVSGEFTFEANEDYSYEIQFTAQDFFTNNTAYGNVLSTFTLINYAADGKSLSFGGAYNENLGGIAQFFGNVYSNGRRVPGLTDYAASVNGGSNEVPLQDRGIYLVTIAPSNQPPTVAIVTNWDEDSIYISILAPGNANATITTGIGTITISYSQWYQYSVVQIS